MSENNKSNNTGCIVSITLIVLGNLIYFFATASTDSIAETGKVVLTIIGLTIAYFVCKFFRNKSDYCNDSKTYSFNTTSSTPTSQPNRNNNSNKYHWVCIFTVIAFVVVSGIVVSLITSSFSFNYAVGVAFTIIFIIGIGVITYNSFKE